MKKLFTVFVLIILVFTVLSEARAQGFIRKYFVDTTDNAFDVSNFLASQGGMLVYPVVITEPAVGYGAGLGLIFFHRSKYERETGHLSKLPPSMTMVGGLATVNGTWAGMVAHMGSYWKDRIRYKGVIGWLNVNATYFGTGKILEDFGIDFNLNGFLTFHEALYRFHKTHFFAGLNYTFFSSEAKFNPDRDIPWLEELGKDIVTGGANIVLQWDSRDNMFTPNRGLYASAKGGYYGKELGGQRNFNSIKARSYYYSPVGTKKLISGFRFNGSYRWGDVPFYSLPFVDIRGIPAMRYQGNVALVGETEWRWNFWHRWSIIGFVGSGWVGNEFNELMFDQAKIAYGGGFRYFIAKDYGIHMGIDVAKGPEDWAWYITLGSAWFR